ncbi:putative methyltransferase [Actinacidiphila reveromycinica]|uniref:Putative methyltransferase n=2 Tax=Actinacidiphila reveromycinica TaxID=659352 RepID=A0A7U3VRV7_9ACTN|nr:class I SAM-dependent methyltransferase [Streptomyces sp. SN-593]BBB01174.1 putative methyltransferase [Streptomyces sp. SN-593]
MAMDTVRAHEYAERWEGQQQRYAIAREERAGVIADVVEHVTAGRERPLVIDLGCGPGTLTARLAAGLPGVEFVGVDRDPVVLGLARECHGSAVRFAEAAIGAEGWTAGLGLDRPADAVVSTTTLHCLPEPLLRRAYRQLGGLLRPGGVLVNGDHFAPEATGPGEISARIGRLRAERQRAFDHEDWDQWWNAVAGDPAFADLVAERRRRAATVPSTKDSNLPLSHHVRLLRAAGFGQAGSVWQCGGSHVLVAVA